jgi:hypothetical protein
MCYSGNDLVVAVSLGSVAESRPDGGVGVNHKYGFHVNAVGDQVFDAIVRIKPRVIKTLHHDVNFWKRVREVHPKAFIIGRLYTPNQEFQSDPAGRAREFSERILREEVNRASFQGAPLYNAWESFNEAIPESVSPDVMQAYDAFAQRMQAAGFEPIAMNFGTGNFLGHHFLNYFPGTLETYRYLGFHEYDWPTLWRLHKESEAENGGMWLTLRYRRIMNEVRPAYPNRHTVIMTECGMTQGVNPQGVGDVGPWHASHPISEDDYWTSLMWYNDELMKDDYVMGACLFVVGAIAPWQSFEHLGGIMDRLERFQAKEASQAAEASQPEVVTSSTTAAGGPVVVEAPVVDGSGPTQPPQPEGHYLLLPRQAPWDWYAACRFYFERFRPSLGENVHAAARAEVITCVNPDQETLASLGQLNPSARLDIIRAADPAELSARVGQRILSGKAYDE